MGNGSFRCFRMFAIPHHLFVLGQLPLHFVNGTVNGGVGVGFVVVGNQDVVMLDVYTHLGPHDVFYRFQNDFDRLNTVKISVKFPRFLLGVLFEGWRVLHMSGRKCNQHENSFHIVHSKGALYMKQTGGATRELNRPLIAPFPILTIHHH